MDRQRFPVRIGVTGRRSLPPGMPELLSREFERLVRAAYDEHAHCAFDRGDVEYTVVTPLAEGADRLVAREVLKRPASRMEVVLPMLESDYLQTFDTEAARTDFLEMTAGLEPLCLYPKLIPDVGRAEVLEDCYWASGEYVVRNCDVLFALWDGLPSKGRGGTSHVVEFARGLGKTIALLWVASGAETVQLERPRLLTFGS